MIKYIYYLKVVLLAIKDEVFIYFYKFKARAKNNIDNYKINIFILNNSRKYINKYFNTLFKKASIIY